MGDTGNSLKQSRYARHEGNWSTEEGTGKTQQSEDNEACLRCIGGGGLRSPTRSGSAVQRGKRRE